MMILLRFISLMIVILLYSTPVNAANFPHLKTGCVSYGLNNASDALLQEYANRFDFLIGPYSSKIAKLKALNPNIKMIAYDNFTNLPDRMETKWQLLEEYCFKNFIDLEDLFTHFSEDTILTISGSPLENKLGGYRVADYSTNVAGVLMFDGTSYKNKSGGVGTYPTNVNFGNTSSSILYLGHWQKFFQINLTLSVKASGWTGSWEYWNGSSWTSLSVSDGTSRFTKDGIVIFVPPSNWKWSKINGVSGGYWVRLKTTTSGSIYPVASSIKKESYNVYQGTSGKYLVPGWDPINDRNGDGFIDDSEFSSLANPKATARFKYQSRIPTFYWTPERFVNNLGNSNYRVVNANYVKLATTTLYGGAAYDGIFEDNCIFNDGATSPAAWGWDKKLGYYTLNSGGRVVEYPGESPGVQFTKDHLLTDEAAYKELKSLGKLLIGNSSGYYADNPNYNYPPLNLITISNGTAGGYFASNIHDGCFREFWMIPKGSISLQGEWSDPIQGVKTQVNYANDLCVTGNKMGFFHVRSSESTNPPDFPLERERMYSLSHFYLVNDNRNAYFVFTQGNNFSSYWWWKAIEYDIGAPLGGVNVWATGTDSAGDTYYVYSREYTKALVLTKPLPRSSGKFYDSSSPITTHNLNGTYQRLNYDGTLSGPISQISLKNIEAAILIKIGSTSLPSPHPTITPTPTPTPTHGHKGSNKEKSNTTGSQMFLAVSQTNTNGPPIGNIKKYELTNSTNVTTTNGSNNSGGVQVVDSTKTPALDSNNLIKDSSKSSWSSGTDGKQVDKGGVGEVLLSRTKPRNIFSNFGDSNLMSESNEFSTSNKKITPELLGLAPGDTAGRDKLIQFIQGYDAYSKTKGTSALVKRAWILGAIVNSRPLVIPYGNSRSVIFVGANDGIFHAFDNATGEELWGFIPDELLSHLKDLTSGNKLEYFVDGSPKAYITESQKIIIFGLRRGGSYYSALDVTDPDNPRFLWEIGPETTGFSEMGQTWSTPQIGKIKHGSGEKVVCFIGGGYDENQDKKTPATEDKKGRAVYVVDLFTGQQVWRWDYARDPNMKYSIPSDISCVDTNGDGYIDRLYVGDTGGKLWRFDINGSDPTAWSGSTLFNSSAGLLGGSRKIFSRPDVTLEKGHEMLFFGTGDREHPDETKVMNQIYAIKDKGLNSTLSERDLENVTDGINNLKSIEDKEGWFISLENKGEKALAPPVVIFGVAYFTTFAPSSGSTEGIARIYALDYKNGGPIIDLNAENNTEGIKIDSSDRSRIIGTGIPSGVVFSAINGKPVGYAGFQGGVYNTPLKKNSTIIPIWWREVSKK